MILKLAILTILTMNLYIVIGVEEKLKDLTDFSKISKYIECDSTKSICKIGVQNFPPNKQNSGNKLKSYLVSPFRSAFRSLKLISNSIANYIRSIIKIVEYFVNKSTKIVKNLMNLSTSKIPFAQKVRFIY